MRDYIKKITKEDYEEIMAANPRGYLTSEIERKHFDMAILCGYGLYGARAIKLDDGYFIKYQTGSSCD